MNHRSLSPLWRLATLALVVGCGSLQAESNPAKRTEITSDQMEMQGAVDRNLFYFTGNVHVTGTNLDIRCDRLTVVAFREGPKDATVGDFGAVESIVAAGNVVISQGTRTAFAGRAEVDPKAGTVTLSEKPRLKDKDVEVEGYQFVLYKDQKKFVSIPDPNAPKGETPRSKVSLGALPNVGFDQDMFGGKGKAAETPAPGPVPVNPEPVKPEPAKPEEQAKPAEGSVPAPAAEAAPVRSETPPPSTPPAPPAVSRLPAPPPPAAGATTTTANPAPNRPKPANR